MPSEPTPALRRARAVRILLVAALVVAFASLWTAAPSHEFRGDERDYLREAVHVARDGVFSSAPVAETEPSADAYREPAYAWVVAATWRLAGAPVPGDEADWTRGRFVAAARCVRALGALLLAAAAAAAGFAARGAGAARATALASALAVLLSPALRGASGTLDSEILAATLTAAAAAAWIAAVRSPSRTVLLVAAALTGVAPLARGAALVLIPVGALVLASGPAVCAPRRRGARVLLFLLLATLPSALWCARNRSVGGHFALAGRGGQVLWTRAELDRQLAREGIVPALLEWTPLDAARELRRSLAPESRISDYRWRGVGNYFTRSLRRWHVERSNGDPLGAERRLAAEAVATFLRHPLDHLRATVAVGWRGLFAERSPAWSEPLDLTFLLGLALALGFVRRTLLAGRSRRPADLALVAAPLALFLFHALATEFLPRFGVPALPLVWAAALTAWPGAGSGPVPDGVRPGEGRAPAAD